MNGEPPSEAGGLYQELVSAQALLDELQETASPELAEKLDELAETLDALAAERDLLSELQAAQSAHVPIGELMLAFRNELLTLLVAIEGYADLVLNQLREPLSKHQAQFLHLILRNITSTVKLIHNFTDVIRIREDQIDLLFEAVSLRDVSAGFQARTAEQVRARNHTLEINFPDDLPDVWADLWRLDQVMTELVTNACSYTPDGGTIIVRAETAEGGVRISVSDTGVGMTSEHLGRLGDLFFRSAHSQVREQPGAGLGFFTAQHLVRMMGGEIEVESEPEVGSTFSFTLPLAP